MATKANQKIRDGVVKQLGEYRYLQKDTDPDTSKYADTDQSKIYRKPVEGQNSFINDKVSDDGDAGRGKVNPKYAKGGSVGSASKRADGVARTGKTKGRFI